MSDERGQNLFIIAYPGRETADKVYHTLRELEKQDRIDIKTAATIYRREDGKLRLKHRQRLTLWRDEFGVEAIALMLAGTKKGSPWMWSQWVWEMNKWQVRGICAASSRPS